MFEALRVLLWKNWVLKKRRPWSTLAETLVPLVLFLLIVWVRTRIKKSHHEIEIPPGRALLNAGPIGLVQSLGCGGTTLEKPNITALELAVRVINDTGVDPLAIVGALSHLSQEAMQSVQLLARTNGNDALDQFGIGSMWELNYLLFQATRLATSMSASTTQLQPPPTATNVTASHWDTVDGQDGGINLDIIDLAESEEVDITLGPAKWSLGNLYHRGINYDMLVPVNPHFQFVPLGESQPYLNVELKAKHTIRSLDVWFARAVQPVPCLTDPILQENLTIHGAKLLFSDSPFPHGEGTYSDAAAQASKVMDLGIASWEELADDSIMLEQQLLQQPDGSGPGFTLDVWDGLPLEPTLRALFADPRFPHNATRTEKLEQGLFLPEQNEPVVGFRMRTTFVPPQTGFYTFYLSSDGESELLVWPADDPDASQRVSHCNFQEAPADWFRESRASAPMFMDAGRPFTMEVYGAGQRWHCQHMTVAVTLPSGAMFVPLPSRVDKQPLVPKLHIDLDEPLVASSVRIQLPQAEAAGLGVTRLSVNAAPAMVDATQFLSQEAMVRSDKVCKASWGGNLHYYFNVTGNDPHHSSQHGGGKGEHGCNTRLTFDLSAFIAAASQGEVDTVLLPVVRSCQFVNGFVPRMVADVLAAQEAQLGESFVQAIALTLQTVLPNATHDSLPKLRAAVRAALEGSAEFTSGQLLAADVDTLVAAVTGYDTPSTSLDRLPQSLSNAKLVPAMQAHLAALETVARDNLAVFSALLQIYNIPDIKDVIDGKRDAAQLLCGAPEGTSRQRRASADDSGNDDPSSGPAQENSDYHGLRRLMSIIHSGHIHVYYSPNYGEVEELMEHVRKPFYQMAAALSAVSCVGASSSLRFFPDPVRLLEIWRGVPTEEALLNATMGSENFYRVLGGVAFRNVREDGTLPDNVEYAIRFEQHKTLDTRRFKKSQFREWGTGTWWRYYYMGFLFVQDVVDRGIINWKAVKSGGQPSTVPVFMQEFPIPEFEADPFSAGVATVMPMFIVLAWIYTVSMTVKSVVYEKEHGLKESMKIVGLPNWAHWAGWFITTLIQLTVSVTLLTIIMSAGNALPKSNPLALWLVLEVYAISSIALSFLMSCFFSKAKLAAACAGIVYFLLYLPYIFVMLQIDQLDYSAMVSSMLSATTALGLACEYISHFEQLGVGLQFSNMAQGLDACDNVSVSLCLGMMILDTFLYAVLTWYIEAVFPGEFGIPKPWWFPFQKEYWMGTALFASRRSKPLSDTAARGEDDGDDDDDALLTGDDSNFSGVQIRNVEKTYESPCTDLGPFARCVAEPVQALKGVSFEAPHGAITVLLGHNGAGKTTLMSILCGLFPPTAGSIVVNGREVSTDIHLIRKNLGFCPQHNVLFEDLSCMETLLFTARVKGLSWPQARSEAERFLKDVGLWKDRDSHAGNLSGGMKRKLSLCAAFIGGSKVVVLDEPSAGLDPGARHDCWDLLLRFRKDRTVLISTHYMDEADVLGDNIGVISSGKLCAYGSSMQLKRDHGIGYSLTVTVETSLGKRAPGDAGYAAMNEFYARAASELLPTVVSMVPGSALAEIKGCDITFTLPTTELDRYPDLLAKLERDRQALGISEFGIAAPSLEDTFIRITERAEADENAADSDDPAADAAARGRHANSDFDAEADGDLDVASSSVSAPAAGSGAGSASAADTIKVDLADSSLADSDQYTRRARFPWFHRFKALFIKRFHNARRDRRAIASQILLPAVFVWIALMVATAFPPGQDRPSLKLTVGEMSVTCDGGAESNTVPFFDGVQSPESFRVMQAAAQLARAVNLTQQQQFAHPTGSCGPDCTFPMNVSSYILDTYDTLDGTRYGAVSIEKPRLATIPFSASGGASTTEPLMRAWFDSRLVHSAPVFLNFANNALLRGHTNDTDATITAYNHPLPLTFKQKSEAYLRSGTDLTVAIMIIVAMSFVPASFVVYLVNERATKAKHLQFVSGATPLTYWTSTFAWDFINYLIPAFICMMIFFAYGLPAYTGRNFSTICLLLLMFGWSITPMMYPGSFLFRVPATAYVTLICANLFIGLTGTLATFILDVFAESDPVLEHVNKVLHWVLLLFPQYCLGRGVIEMARNEYVTEYRELIEGATDVFKAPYEWDICGRNLFFMAIEGFVFFLLIVAVEFLKTWQIRRSNLKASATQARRGRDNETEDDDVVAERRRVGELACTRREGENVDDVLVVNNLSKVYKPRNKKKRKVAVDRLAFGVHQGECFGLLGVNGAGKTSTFKMLTGDHSVSSGEAWVNNHSILKTMHKVQQSIGYTPQFDALNGLLTARETLFMYARLRGIAERDIPALADWAINNLKLNRWADRPARTYSGGNKRKLSVAIALMPGSRLLMMDEPSAGVDVRARRFLWRVIRSAVHHGRSVLLTSHAMDECEALCSRLGIMVNGKFYCMGSPQHLKSKFGKGYNLIVKVRQPPATAPNTAAVKDFVAGAFEGAELLEEHQGYLAFLLPVEGMPPLSEAFRRLHDQREPLQLEDYLLSQATLHSVFQAFSLLQDSDRVDAEDSDDIVAAPLGDLDAEDDPAGTADLDDGDAIPLLPTAAYSEA